MISANDTVKSVELFYTCLWIGKEQPCKDSIFLHAHIGLYELILLLLTLILERILFR
jgi:hypothetical protein